MNAKRVFNALVISLAVDSFIEIITGIHLALFYKPDPQRAYQSVQQIQSNGALNFEQNFHHWMSAVIIVAAGITLLFGLITASYRNSSRKLWVSSIILVVLYVLFQLTGHILPWDQHAVRTAAVETSIAQAAPVIGVAQANLLRGGTQVGPQTLTIWFWAHVIVLSIVWLFFTWLAVRKARMNGVSKAVLIVGFILDVAVAAALAWSLPVKFGAGATSADFTTVSARPEWYILPMHQLLTLFQRLDASFGWIGTMLIPALVLLLVILAPWIDVRARRGQSSIYGPVFGVMLFAGACVLFAMASSEIALPNGPNVFAAANAQGISPKIPLDPKLIAQGQQLVQTSGCLSCHSISGPRQAGLPLSKELARAIRPLIGIYRT